MFVVVMIKSVEVTTIFSQLKSSTKSYFFKILNLITSWSDNLMLERITECT